MNEPSKQLSNTIEELQRVDYETYAFSETKHPLLAEALTTERVDYFDVTYGPDPLHKLDVHHLAGTGLRPVIVFIHGGGWTRRDKDLSRFVVPSWIAEGYTVVSINYRLTDPTNPEPALRNAHPTQIDDCTRALKWIIDNIEDYGGDSRKIAIAGHSSGGHLAALLVSDSRWHDRYNLDISRVKCWISLSGIHDLTLRENYSHPMMVTYLSAFIDSANKVYDASPITHFKGTEPPGMLAHGTGDYMVPMSNSEKLFDSLLKKGIQAELHAMPGAMHMDYFSRISDPEHVLKEPIKDFLARHLKTNAATERNMNYPT